MTGPTATEALLCWCSVGVCQVLPPLGWVVIPRYEIFDYCQVGELTAPPTPLADGFQWPALV
jgi:hypothetical protein